MSTAFLLIPALLLTGSLLISGVYFMKSRANKSTHYEFYALTFPNDLSAEQSANFWNSVASTFAGSHLLPDRDETVVIELRSDVHGLQHRLGIPWQHSALLDKLRAQVPGIHTEEAPIKSQPKWSRAYEVGISDRTRLLDISRVEAVTTSIMTAMAHDVKDGDHLAVQLVVNPIGKVKPPSETRAELSSKASPLALMYGSLASKEEIKERRAKHSESQFKVVLRFVAASSTDARAEWLLGNVKRSYHELNSSSTFFFTRRFTKRDKVINRFNGALPVILYPAQVNVTELIALSGWPVGSPQIGGLTLGKTRYLPPNETILRNGRRLGLSYQDRPIAISPEDGCRHMYVIGPSGLGKTTLLANSLQQDIERGYGAVVMESKGDLFNAALNAVPRERIKDVVVMDLTDSEWPVGVNVLAGKNRNAVVDAMTNLFAYGTGGDIYFRDLMYHGLHAICAAGLTLTDLVPFLHPQTPMEKAWREGIINGLKKTAPEFYQYWKGFDLLKPTEQRQRIQPVLNRLWQISSRRDVRNLLGQSESTIDFREIMRDNKLLFVYLPDSIGDETVSLLTSLLFKEMWDAVREVKEFKTKPTYLYLDEMQKLKGYINLTVVLSLARSFKFGLVMAHQYRSQLSPELQSAITNAATMVSFKLDGPDAGWIQSLMGKSVTPDDFMNLGPYEVIARLAINGGSSSPTFFRTLAPVPAHNRAQEAIQHSRTHFARPASDVDKAILKRRSAPSRPTKARPTFGFVEKDESDE